MSNYFSYPKEFELFQNLTGLCQISQQGATVIYGK